MTDEKKIIEAKTEVVPHFDTIYESIIPWNGSHDRGSDVRLKWERNFARISQNFRILAEFIGNMGDMDSSKFIRKDQADKTNFLLTLMAGAFFGDYKEGISGAKIDAEGFLTSNRVASHLFTPGMLGTGFAMTMDMKTGTSSAEVDYLTVRKSAIFNTLTIHEAKHVGGEVVISPAAIIAASVEDIGNGYKIGFRTTDSEGRKIYNEFAVGDQARCKTYNLDINQYWWRLVTDIGSDYIVVSKTDADRLSQTPKVGDNISQLGNRTDKSRQNAQVISAYGVDAPSRKMYQGINSYNLTGTMVLAEFYDPSTGKMKSINFGENFVGNPDMSSFMSYSQKDGLKIKGQVEIQPGSQGWQNLEGLDDDIKKRIEEIEVGAENLLRNTGFTGDYDSRSISEIFVKSDDIMYSEPLSHWSGSATVVEDTDSASGYAAQLGGLSQTIFLVAGDQHILSIKAKGSDITFSVNGQTEYKLLDDSYQRVSLRFTSALENKVIISGMCTICEVKLERGTIATDWCPHRKDRNEVADDFRKFWYLLDALGGTTSIDGGMILTSIIRLGQFKDGQLQKVNGAISGIYNNDYDVAYCAGGDLDKAIYTVKLYKEDPKYQPTKEELKNIANVVITHGGLAILSNVIVRGGVFADYGIFRGEVHADGGVFKNICNPNGYFEINEEGKLKAIDAELRGVFRQPWHVVPYQLIYQDAHGEIWGFDTSTVFYDRIKFRGFDTGNVMLAWGPNTSGREIMLWNDVSSIIDNDTKIQVLIKKDCYIFHAGAVYSYSDKFYLPAQSITHMISCDDGWIVLGITELKITTRDGNNK